MIEALRILGNNIKVVVDDKFFYYDNDDNIAVYQLDFQRIIIDDRYKECLELPLMHEVIEWIKAECDLAELSHQDISTISTVLCAVLKDNPEFIRMFA
jgi:hypothetical protein